MVDFFKISTRSTKKGIIEIYPKFIIKKSKDLMIRGGDFYAIWLNDISLWSTDEHDALDLIDGELDKYAEENQDKFESGFRILYMWDAENGMIDNWIRYCQRQMRDNFTPLDERIIFSNHKTVKEDYASKKLDYPLEKGSIDAYNKLMSTLYSAEERRKLEWAIGSIVTGDSKTIQKFIVLYGSAGTGKSTILNIIQRLFAGYYSVFDAKALGSSSNSFALEAFKNNPLVAIQHDGDLSRIEDNTRLNSLVSHEMMTVNEKFKSTYASRFQSFLFMGTNKPVKITDSRSGLVRRLIDVSPSGDKLSFHTYSTAVKQVEFELGAIAYHCKEVYLSDPNRYDDYIPTTMMGASNDFYNYMIDSYHIFKKDDGVTLKAAWEMYKVYCDEAQVPYPFSQRVFKEELRDYFHEYDDRFTMEDGQRVRSYYKGFRYDRFINDPNDISEEPITINPLELKEQQSIFDVDRGHCPAQYATSSGTPTKAWDSVKTSLSDLNTGRLHYVRVPENHIVIDFDITDDDGKKNLEANMAEAAKWPKTYAEVSKSGGGIHLHYIYSGDVSRLKRVYSDEVEIKVSTGKSSLRRKLTKCNNLPIATISSGLPLRGEKRMVNFEAVKSEKGLRSLIRRNLNKEVHASTKPSIDFIYKILEDAYDSDLKYDLSDMKSSVLAFAANSTNQAEYCLKLVNQMEFKSKDPSNDISNDSAKIVFYDVEVFPNLLVVNWKIRGKDKPVVRMINPDSDEIEELMRFRLVGFNCRRYDNHILYARLLGYTNEQLYNLSKRIISGDRNAYFREAYNVSYTDVYDFSSKKQSLKKFQIELGIHHQELGLPWDEPVDESLWPKVAEYCDNDVIATEAVFEARYPDFVAREILADLAGMTVNATTNSLTTRIIFGKNYEPQDRFNYRNMGELPEDWYERVDEHLAFDKKGRPIFDGYKFEMGKSTYRGEEVGEGGYVYAEPGMYSNVALLDVEAMHPSSIIAENLFGDEYTSRYKDILDARIAIKHRDFDTARTMLNGALKKYLDDESRAGDLSNALKIAINSVYGLTSAAFNNQFRDVRNKDNIAAKRGALFMINLKHEVQKKGFIVAHIKTDSIKIPDATPEIIEFVSEYGKRYGYTFDHEATYDRFCLVNKAVFISRDASGKNAGKWSATGTQFQIPYVFKKIFSKEPIVFDDLCETKSVTTALYLDMNEDLPDVSKEEKELYAIVKQSRENGVDIDIYKKHENTHINSLIEAVAKGHDYRFIGRDGRFCPIKKGAGGGELLRKTDAKSSIKGFGAVTGSKGYRWLEAEYVEQLGLEDAVDRNYYDALVDDAIDTISKYGDYEWFVSNDI